MNTNSMSNSDPIRRAFFTLIFGVAAATALWALPATARGDGIIFEVGRETFGTVGEYTTSGAPVDATLIGGVETATGIAVSEGKLFITSYFNGTVREYTTSGMLVNASLISGLDKPQGIAVSGTDLFVASGIGTGNGRIGKYTTSGATVNAAFITGLHNPSGMAVSGTNLFVANSGNGIPSTGKIGKYNASTGATVNASLISGFMYPSGVAVSGANLFITILGDGTPATGRIGKYTTAGATVNASLVTGLDGPEGIAVSGTDLFVTNFGTAGGDNGKIGKYTTAGATLNASLVTGLNNLVALVVVPCTAAPGDMVGWWPGEDDASDIQGSHHGTPQSGLIFASGQVGRAFRFNGAGAVVEVPDNAAWDFGANEFTIDTWVNFAASGSSSDAVFISYSDAELAYSDSEGSGALNKWIFRLANAHLELHYNGSAVANITSSATFTPDIGKWYHVAVTRTGSTYKFYVNGTQNGANQSDSNAVPAANGPLTFGKAAGTPSLNGRLDEIEIFHRALRVSEIADIYKANAAGKCRPECIPPPPDMVGWWPANGNTIDVQNGNNGTLKGAATFAAGRVKQGFSLAGGSDFVSVGNPPLLKLQGSMTIDAWIRPDDFPEGGVRAIVTKWGQDPSTCGAATSDSYALLLRKQSGVIKLHGLIHQPTDGGTEPSLLGGNITAGVFSHVAMTYNANIEAFVIYVNGVSVANAAVPPSGLCTSDKEVLFGSEDSSLGPARRFSGVIDEVEIFRRALDATEIQAIYDAGSTGKCKSLLQLTSAVSRKTHGAAGTFDVNLPLTGAPGVECRTGGGNYTLVFTFTNNIVSGSASVTSGMGSVSGSPTLSGKTMTVNLTGVADVQKITLTLSNVTDGFAQVLPSAPVSVIMLIGDTTGNKSVNSSDIGQTKSQSGMVASSANFRTDVTHNGSINASDIGLVKSRSGASVP